MAVPTLDNLADETQLRGPGVRSIIATAGEGYSPLPLIPGTEKYAHNWMRQWHMSQQSPEVSDVACYIDVDTVVSGDGLIWIEDHLVTSPEVMPPYVATGLALETGGCARLHNDRTLSIRTVSEPCLVAVGHGTQVYGHFLIEMLFRILVAAEALKETHSRYRILLDRKAPPWLIYILNCSLGIRLEDMEFFNPEVERVHLPRGIISGRVHQNSGFHPIANTLLDRLISSLPTSSTQYPSRRFFILRNRFMNPHAPQRICKNEQKLAEIALKEHDFTPITIEDLAALCSKHIWSDI
jgi:Glycosyltransferase 61